MRWEMGRQGGGYRKMKLFSSEKRKMDIYLLHFPEGSEVPIHIDPAPEGFIHQRLNIFLKRPKEGGQIFVEGPVLNIGPFNLFMASVWRHLMTRVTKGSAYILSIGWLEPR